MKQITKLWVVDYGWYGPSEGLCDEEDLWQEGAYGRIGWWRPETPYGESPVVKCEGSGTPAWLGFRLAYVTDASSESCVLSAAEMFVALAAAEAVWL